MNEYKIIQGTFTVIEDDIDPPFGPMPTSKFKSINEWLTEICENEKPAQPIGSFKIGLFESPDENILYLVGTNETEEGDVTRITIDFEPEEKFFLLPKDEYNILTRDELLKKVVLNLKDFTKTERFKTSFITQAINLIFESNGEIIWAKAQ